MATIKDVARLSGVSMATVSQALNQGGRPVHEDTKNRVLQAAQQLDYRPNPLARGLVGKRMNTIGVVFSHWDAPHVSPFILGALLGVLSLAGSRRQRTMLINLDYSKWEEELPNLCDVRCDGILLMVPPEDRPLPAALLERKVPCVLMSAKDASGQAPSVDVDNFRAAFEMTNALLQMGHHRIAFVCPAFIQETVTSFARERHEGYRQAMIAAGAYAPNMDGLPGESAAILALRSSQPPTAFFCLFDELALRLIEQLQEQGVRVPDKVSIAGFDDIPQAAMNRPALSTVRQPINRLGERAAEMLLATIDGVIPAGHQELLPTELVLRGTTVPPRA